jgi:hypothetical protein
MPKWEVYGAVVGSKYLGEVEADTAEEAKAKGWNLDSVGMTSLCHECEHECEDPSISEVIVSRQPEADSAGQKDDSA